MTLWFEEESNELVSSSGVTEARITINEHEGRELIRIVDENIRPRFEDEGE